MKSMKRGRRRGGSAPQKPGATHGAGFTRRRRRRRGGEGPVGAKPPAGGELMDLLGQGGEGGVDMPMDPV